MQGENAVSLSFHLYYNTYMAKSNFKFNPYPYRFISSFKDDVWHSSMEVLEHRGKEVEATLSEEELNAILKKRNESLLPLVNYTTQYGLGCFEGLKAYPQGDGSYALFRIDANAQRFYNSMQGLHMPPFPTETFISAITELLQKSIALGYKPLYNPEWEKNNFASATSIYIRPFSYAEGGIGVNCSSHPSVIIVATEVGSYFDIQGIPSIVVSDKIRATPNGTGWIKAASNYVISALAKNDAITRGCTECLFLDSQHRSFVEECSSCNIFFILENGTVVTPHLGDTILPGITRDSVITLLKEKHIPVEERAISIDEVFDSAKECFATGTAVGVNYFGALVHNNKKKIFGDGSMGETTQYLLSTLKKIQYGLIPDSHHWMRTIPSLSL